MHKLSHPAQLCVPQQGQPGQADGLVCGGVLLDHLHRQLHQLRVGGGCGPAGAGFHLQHWHHRAQWRHFHGDLLLCEQDHLPRGRTGKIKPGRITGAFPGTRPV